MKNFFDMFTSDEPSVQLMNKLSMERGRTKDPNTIAASRFFEGMYSGEQGRPHFSLPIPGGPGSALAVSGAYELAKMVPNLANKLFSVFPSEGDLHIDSSTSPPNLMNPLAFTAGQMVGSTGIRNLFQNWGK